MISQSNLVSSWTNEHRLYVERMSIVQKLLDANRTLLYDNYNKENFKEFRQSTENLIILENFLRKSNQLITNASTSDMSKAATGALIENLKNQVKPRERKLFFPEQ